MIYSKYAVIKKCFIGGILYYQGDVLGHQDGFEIRKSLEGIGEPTIPEEAKQVVENKTENEEESSTDEIKRGAPGKWKLPNGDTFTGKLAEAKEYWEELKKN